MLATRPLDTLPPLWYIHIFKGVNILVYFSCLGKQVLVQEEREEEDDRGRQKAE